MGWGKEQLWCSLQNIASQSSYSPSFQLLKKHNACNITEILITLNHVIDTCTCAQNRRHSPNITYTKPERLALLKCLELP